MVRAKGLEPSRPKALAPKASVSTNSTTRALMNIITEGEIFVTTEGACAIIESKHTNVIEDGRGYE